MSKYFRSFLWARELFVSLFKYLLKNPISFYRVPIFFIRKIRHIPMFLHRNTETEYYGNKYEDLIAKTVKLYDRLEFNPEDKKYYKKLEGYIENPYQLLYFLVREFKPEIIIETGVAGGVSTGFILQGIMDNGHGKLYSIDLPFQWYSYGLFELHLDSLPTGKLPGYLVPEYLKKNWKLIIGDTYVELPKLLKKFRNIDMFFHDSEHTNETMLFEYRQAWPKLSKKGVLVSDDIGFSKAFDKFAEDKKSRSFIFTQLGIILK